MKQFIVFLSAVALFACNEQSKPNAESFDPEEKQNIEIAINLHNDQAALDYQMAAIKAKTDYKIKHIRTPEAKLQEGIKLHLDSFASQYFNTNSIARDTALTFEKYLSWCKAEGEDPKEAYKFLD